MQASRLILALSASFAPAKPVDRTTPTVGVLQELYLAPWDRQTLVRPAFRKTGPSWVAFPDGFRSHHPRDFDRAAYAAALDKMREEVPAGGTWGVCLAGKSLGEVRTIQGVKWDVMPLRGALGVVGPESLPWQGHESWEHAGVDSERPTHRPLSVTSSMKFGDPQQWTERELPRDLSQALGERLSRATGSSVPCEAEDGSGRCTVSVSRWSVRRSLASKEGAWLVEAEAVNRGPNREFLFLLAGESTRLLGTEMWVLDVADDDGDGRSEVLVMFQRYNHEGLTLFYGPGLAEVVSYGWRIQ